MRRLVLTCIALLLVPLAGGCDRSASTSSSYPLADHYAEMNAATLKQHNAIARESAIIRQHTVYPYHFVEDSAELNTLGEQELGVLVRHRAKHAGPVNVNRGEEPEELYNSRVQTVYDRLAAAGISRDRIEISDGIPGGGGLQADEVVIIRSQMMGRKGTSGGSGGASGSGMGSGGSGTGGSY